MDMTPEKELALAEQTVAVKVTFEHMTPMDCPQQDKKWVKTLEVEDGLLPQTVSAGRCVFCGTEPMITGSERIMKKES